MTNWTSKIKKLQTLAEGAGTDAERDAVNERIAELAAKFGIDLVRDAMAGAEDEMVLKSFEINLEFARCHSRLMYRVMEALGCKAIFTDGEGADEVAVVGYLSDIERGELIYSSLSLQMTMAADKYHAWTRTAKISYLVGFADGAGEVLKAAEGKAQMDAQAEDVKTGRPGVALELAARRDRVALAFDGEYPTRGKRRGGRVDATAYGDGKAAGRRADLGNGSGNVCQPAGVAALGR